MASFIHFDESDDEYAADVRVDEIVMLVDKKDRGTKVVLRGGYEFMTTERANHLRNRIDGMIR